MECPNKFQIVEYIKLSIVVSLQIQTCMYVLLPFRKKIRSKLVLGFISIICLLGNWIPASNLIIICSFAVINYDHCYTDEGHVTSSLLNWASITLLQLAGHGQERETPRSIHLGETAKESCKIILEFIFYLMIFVIAFGFLFPSLNDESMICTLTFVVLACTRTFGKLKHLQDAHEILKQGNHVRKDEEHYYNVTVCARSLPLNPVGDWREINNELKFVYSKFYGGVVPSLLEIFIFSAVVMSLSPKLVVVTFGTLYNFLILSLKNLGKKINNINNFLLLKALLSQTKSLILVRYTTSLNISFISVLILTITHFFLALPIVKKYFSAHQWSRTIPQFNLLEYSLFRKPSKLSTSINYILSTWSLSGNEKYKDEIGEFIFKELKKVKLQNDGNRSLDAASIRGILLAKDLWVPEQNNNQDLKVCKATFEETVIQWHFVTTILYHTQDDDNRSSYNSYLSKVLSDYMGYLLIVQPWIMSKQRGAVLKTCLKMWLQVSEFIKQHEIIRGTQEQPLLPRRVIKKMVTKLEQDQTKAVLLNARVLAKKLKSKFEDENERWSYIVKVWVKMLAYGAIRCNTMGHIQGLGQGGELATIVWIWMLGLGFKQQNANIRPTPSPSPSPSTTHTNA